MLRYLFICSLLAFAVWPRPSVAHGSVTPEDDICIMRIGFYKAHFKIYLPATHQHEEFCEDLPAGGETVFVMEYEHPGLSDVPIDFRIIRNVTERGIFTSLDDVRRIENIDDVTVVHHEPALQPDVFTLRYDFPETGEFVGIVTVPAGTAGDSYVAVFPFEVGFAGFGWWPWFVAIALLLQLNYLRMNGWFERLRKTRMRQKLVVIDGSRNG